MSNYFIPQNEANTIDNLNDGNRLLKIGSRLKTALDFVNTTKPEKKIFVDSTNGSDENDGKTWTTAFETINKAIEDITAYDGSVIFLSEGNYDEVIEFSSDCAGLTVIGFGNIGDVTINKADGSSGYVKVRGNDITFININFSTAISGDVDYSVKITGDRFSAFGCQFENTNNENIALLLEPANLASQTAGTDGSASQAIIENCTFCWCDYGIVFKTYYTSGEGDPSLALTQEWIKNCRFHNVVESCIYGDDTHNVGSVRNLIVENCVFDNLEDGTEPDTYIELDTGTVEQTGIITNNKFATATNNDSIFKIATNIKWVCNMTEAGVSTTRPAS